MDRVDRVGRWTWNTRLGTYEWRDAPMSGLVWVAAIFLAAMFCGVVILGVAVIRQAIATDSSTVARVVAAGDYGSLAGWVVDLGHWALVIGTLAVQQYWPFMLIGVPAVIGIWVMRKG